jgi:hypothetical protein
MTSLYQILPPVAVLLFLAVTLREGHAASRGWLGPAAVSALFLVWSVYAVAAEGPLGFWPNHTANAWGNQVWFDLLIAVAIGWTLLLPRARAVGMQVWPWLALICCTGCIGLAAMLARCRFLESRST